MLPKKLQPDFMNSYISLSQVLTDKYLIYAKDAQKYDSLAWFDEKVGSCVFVDGTMEDLRRGLH